MNSDYQIVDADYTEIATQDDSEIEDEFESSQIHLTLKSFTSSLEDYRDAIIFALPKMAENRLKEIKRVEKKIKKFESNTDKNGEIVLESAHDVKVLSDAYREYDRLMESKLLSLTARSFFIGIFSEYDKFIGNLLEVIYQKKPELYRGIKKEVSLTDLLDYSSIDDIKHEMLEQEIDAFRRGSYIEQFSEIEKKFEINLKKFDDWQKFIEFAQRRNIMTHNGGCVSKQYLYVCEKEGLIFDKRPEIGDELDLKPDYMFDSIRTISKIGLMLGHTLWRKIFPTEIELADESLNNTIYNLLVHQRWKAAAELGVFSLSPVMVKESKDITKRIRVINTSIGYKFSNNKQEAIKLLDTIDWSASIREFKLAGCILREEYKNASKLMLEIGKKGELIHELVYYEWPLFKDFIGTNDFLKTFEKIYGYSYVDKLSPNVRVN